MTFILNEQPISADKKAIALAFGKAAKTYDKHAQFQREVGMCLMDKLPQDLKGCSILDLGCGTGYFTQLLALRGADVTALDLSPAMILKCRERCAGLTVNYVVGDAENLSVDVNQFDFIFSSLALQWCTRLERVMSSVVRALKPNGKLVYSTLLDGSLNELKLAWQEVDAKHNHINQFHSLDVLTEAINDSSASDISHQVVTMVDWYSSAIELMKDLKGIGATHITGRSPGLTKPQRILQVERAYQRFKNKNGQLPASYQVCLGEIRK